MSTLFRFVAERPVQRAAAATLKYRLIQAYGTGADETALHRDLRAAKQNGDRDAMLSRAHQHIASQDFVGDPAKLPFSLQALDDWMLARHDAPDPVKLVDEIKRLTTKKPKDVVATEQFRTARRQVADSLLALTVADEQQTLRGALLRVMYVLGLFEQLAAAEAAPRDHDHGQGTGHQGPTQPVKTAEDIHWLLSRGTVVLPADVFPLPTPTAGTRTAAGPDGNGAATQDDGQERDLGALTTAITELRAALDDPSEPPAEHEGEETDGNGNGNGTGDGRRPAWRLAGRVRDQLSPEARTVVDAVGGGSGVTIPEAITRLESAAATLGSALPARTAGTAVVTMRGRAVDVGAYAATEPSREVARSAVPADALARRPGVADLLVVRERTRRYELGEVAHVENVLKGEARERTHRRQRTTEETLSTISETVVETEQEIQSTERFDLQREATTALHEDSSLETGLTVSASYGPTVSVTANIGYAANHSRDETAREASTFARQVTERAATRIQERVREERTIRTTELVEEINKHSINNASGNAHVVGVYRWLDKVVEAQVLNYGRRLLLEFVVPEPAAFYLHTLAAGSAGDQAFDRPEPPLVEVAGQTRPLEPGDVDVATYAAWVRRYSVSGVNPPPKRYETIALAWEEPPPGNAHGGNNRFYYKARKELKVPEGYQAVRVAGTVYASAWKHDAYLTVGTMAMRGSDSGGSGGAMPWVFDQPMANESGEIPVTLHIADVWGYALGLEVLCERSPEHYAKWQLVTFDAIMRAYAERKAEYEDQLAAAAVSSGIPISGRNPIENRLIERTELKKSAVAMLTGQHFEDFDAIEAVPPENYPAVDIVAAKEQGATIQFFEQSLEWPQVTYTFYPYFWSRRENWLAASKLEDPDVLFTSFLRAGAARVVVPVRPGFEEIVLHYLATGEMWGGGQVPQVGDPLYLSLVTELQEERGGGVEGTPVGEPWELELPTQLVMLAQDAQLPTFP